MTHTCVDVTVLYLQVKLMECSNARIKAEFQHQESQTKLAALQKANKKQLAEAAKAKTFPHDFEELECSAEYPGSDYERPKQTLLFHCYSPSTMSDDVDG